MGSFLRSDWARQQSLIDLNVSALVHLSYLFGADMAERGNGRIVNMSSVAAFSGGPNMALYYASKAFVLSFSLALSGELKGTGVTVTAVCPGPTTTGFEKSAGMEHSRMFTKAWTMTAARVAKESYEAAMRGKPVKYCGLVVYGFNLATRFLPRTTAAFLAKDMNR